jgi:glutathione S-transferase
MGREHAGNAGAPATAPLRQAPPRARVSWRNQGGTCARAAATPGEDGMVKIHHLGRTRSLRVIWQCEEMGLAYEVIPAAFPITQAYRALNPIGALPFLEDEGGVAINESVAMMLYIATQYGPTPLLPGKGEPHLARVMQFLVFGEATLGAWGNVMMVTRFFAPDDQKQNFTATLATQRMNAALKFTADKLAAGPFLAGAQFTLADISTGYVIGIARGALADQLDIPPTLLAYHDRLQERPAYQRAAAK